MPVGDCCDVVNLQGINNWIIGAGGVERVKVAGGAVVLEYNDKWRSGRCALDD